MRKMTKFKTIFILQLFLVVSLVKSEEEFNSRLDCDLECELKTDFTVF